MKLLKGKVSLSITYWVFGVLPAILYFILVGIIMDNLLKISTTPYIKWIVYVVIFFPYYYYPFIFFAIWKSSNHYTKNKVWPILAKISVILGLALLIKMIISNIIVFNHRNDLPYKLQLETNLLNTQLPKHINKETILTKMTFDKNNNTLTYIITSPHDKSEIKSNLFSDEWKKFMIHGACNKKEIRAALDAGITYVYHVNDNHGATITDVVIKASDCK